MGEADIPPAAERAVAAQQEFCTRYPLFLTTTETVASANRLNARHRAIIGWNADILRDCRVLDLASHDGRWSFAALQTGAHHVTGVEARRHLVDKANGNFAAYRIPPEQYSFVNGLALPAMRALPDGGFDIVMCLGFFYHTLDHMAVLLEARRLATRYLILDTEISPDEDQIIRVRPEFTAHPTNSADYAQTGHSYALVGTPSRSAVFAMLDFAGFDVELFDWNDGTITDWTHLEDYRVGKRITVRATRR